MCHDLVVRNEALAIALEPGAAAATGKTDSVAHSQTDGVIQSGTQALSSPEVNPELTWGPASQTAHC